MTSEPGQIDASPFVPRLKPWLDRALTAVEITPISVEDFLGDAGERGLPGLVILWVVEVTNGLEGDERVAARVAYCDDEIHAELVAAGMWALVL